MPQSCICVNILIFHVCKVITVKSSILIFQGGASTLIVVDFETRDSIPFIEEELVTYFLGLKLKSLYPLCLQTLKNVLSLENSKAPAVN